MDLAGAVCISCQLQCTDASLALEMFWWDYVRNKYFKKWRDIKGRHWVDWDCWALRRSLSSQISLWRSHLRSPLLMPIRWHHHPSSAGTTQFTKHQIHAPESSPSEGACPLILSPGVTLDGVVSSSICLLTWWSLLTIDSCGNFIQP